MYRHGVLLCCSVLLLTPATISDDVNVELGVVVSEVEKAQQVTAALNVANVTVPESEPPEPGEEDAATEATCRQYERNAAVVGGTVREATLAAAAAARIGLPILLVDAIPADHTWEALMLYPARKVLVEAAQALVRDKGWENAVLLHEGPPNTAPLLAPDDDSFNLVARSLPPSDDDVLLRNLLLVLKNLKYSNYIIWCNKNCTEQVLDSAQRVGLLSERHSYLLMTLDAHTLTLEPYSHGSANITTLCVFNRSHDRIVEAQGQWQKLLQETNQDTSKEMPTAVVLAMDGALLVQNALSSLRFVTPGKSGNCETGLGASHASSVLNYIRSREWEHLSGKLSWNENGERVAVTLYIAELHRGGKLTTVGTFSQAGIHWARSDPTPPLSSPDSMINRTFNVLISLSKPYIMRQESENRLSGNKQYEGFGVELIDRLSKNLHFNYNFIVHSGSYDHMLAMLDDENYHFAITDLTITSERENRVDFTTPFMNLGISILFRAPLPPEPNAFAFLLPFSGDVWLCLGFAYIGTSLVLYLVGRLCPDEWQNPYPCIEEPDALENQFTLANAFWFNLGAVLLQGSEIAPVAYGTRAAASAWWLFALVITSSYTANLATLLAQKTPYQEIHNVEELANNVDEIYYGAKRNGATYSFFEHSNNTLYKKMFEHMKTHNHPRTNEDGIKNVTDFPGKYAFLMESTSIEYEAQRNCNISKVGGLLDSKGYGIAMKKNSKLRQALNLAILNLQEDGVLRKMKHKWWNEKHGGGACLQQEEHENERLTMQSFLGLFGVLVIGCVLGIIGSCVDLGLAARRRSRATEASWGRCFLHELRFVFQFSRSVKPVRAALTPSLSSSASSPSAVSPSPSSPTPSSPSPPPPVARSTSPSVRRRRRSSLHAASLRLARHARPSDATS